MRGGGPGEPARSGAPGGKASRSRAAATSPEGAAAPAYEVSLLGLGRVHRLLPGRPPERLRWSLRRAFKAFAYLAAAPEMEAGRDELEEAVWYGADDEAIRRNFHPTLSHLRRSLRGGAPSRDPGGSPPPLVLRQGVYRLNPLLHWRVDAAEFERRCREAREAVRRGDEETAVAGWQGAWKLFGGPFLAGEDDPWMGDRRERIQRLYGELLSGLGELLARAGRLAEAADALRAALIEDPLQERLALHLMRVYGRQGRRDLVHRQYDRLSSLLRQELGVEPLAEITDEYQRLMA